MCWRWFSSMCCKRTSLARSSDIGTESSVNTLDNADSDLADLREAIDPLHAKLLTIKKYNNIGAECAEQMFTVRPVDGCAALRKKQ
jgi:hypothetical protein